MQINELNRQQILDMNKNEKAIQDIKKLKFKRFFL